MKLRLLPLLWIVRVPLVSVGALPHPGLAAATPTSVLAGVVASATPCTALTVARANSAAAAADRNLNIRVNSFG
jgi:hypothetical protein